MVSAAEFSFVAFAELDDLTRCEIQIDEDVGAAAVEFLQSERAVCRAELSIVRL